MLSGPLSHQLHENSRVAAGLIVSRLPLKFEAPEAVEKFRVFQSEWQDKTGHDAVPSDSLVYMRLPSHFLPSPEERAKRKHGGFVSGSSSAISEIDALTAVEGFRPLNGRKEAAKPGSFAQRKSRLAKPSSNAPPSSHEYQSVKRKESDLLHLVVKYRLPSEEVTDWTVPWSFYRSGTQAMKEVMSDITQNQLGLEVFMPGYCPLGHRKMSASGNSTKIFFYRGLWIPGTSNVKLGDQVVDFAWKTRAELSEALTAQTWQVVGSILPLGADGVF